MGEIWEVSFPITIYAITYRAAICVIVVLNTLFIFSRRGAITNLIVNLLFIITWTIQGINVEYDERYNYDMPNHWWRIVVFVSVSYSNRVFYKINNQNVINDRYMFISEIMKEIINFSDAQTLSLPFARSLQMMIYCDEKILLCYGNGRLPPGGCISKALHLLNTL